MVPARAVPSRRGPLPTRVVRSVAMDGLGGWLRRIAPERSTLVAHSRNAAERERLDTARTYRPDLDGFRAIAVGLVILTHANWPWVNNGGDAGVTAFFVL